jgi:hypothetical protein
MVRVVVVLAALGCVLAVLGVMEAAGQSRSAVRIAITPNSQTLGTAVVARRGKPTLAFGTAVFTVRVTNTTAAKLFGVTVTDGRAPRCSRTIGTLASHASVSYSCSLAKVARSFANVASVTAQTGRGLAKAQAIAQASATSSVRVQAKVGTGGALTTTTTLKSTGLPIFGAPTSGSGAPGSGGGGGTVPFTG